MYKMKRSYLFPIYLLTFINAIGFTLMLPVFPYITEKLNANAIHYGLLVAAYPLCQFFGAPILGALSDKHGRRAILMLAQAGTLVGWLLFATTYFMDNHYILSFSVPLTIMIVARMLDGLTGGNTSVVYAYISDVSTAEERTKTYSILGGVTAMGFLLGPALGGLSNSTQYGYLGSVMLALMISLVALYFIWKNVPESLPLENRHETDLDLLNEINIVKKLNYYRTDKFLSSLFLVRITSVFAFMAFTSIAALFAKEILNLNPYELSIGFTLVGCFFVFNQIFSVPFFSNRFGDLRALVYGQIAIVAGLILSLFAEYIVVFGIATFLITMGIAVNMPPFKSLISKNVGPAEQGRVNGTDESIIAAFSAFTPLFISTVYQHAGKYTFSMIGVFMIFGLVIFLRRLRKYNPDHYLVFKG